MPHRTGRAPAPFASVKEALFALIPYIERELRERTRLNSITRHVLGAFHGVPDTRAFRRHLATEAVKPGAGASVLVEALEKVREESNELTPVAA
jgi:tRNA-dihydrouridine synthase A